MENIHRIFNQQMRNATETYYMVAKNVKEMQEKGVKYAENRNIRRNSQGK